MKSCMLNDSYRFAELHDGSVFVFLDDEERTAAKNNRQQDDDHSGDQSFLQLLFPPVRLFFHQFI